VEHQAPLLKRHVPFCFDVSDGQVYGFFGCRIVGKLHFGLGVLADTAVQVLDGVGGVNKSSDFERIIKIAGQILPVILP
jgi:hypothetical protein